MSFLKFNEKATDISEIKIGELILSSSSPYNNTNMNLSTNNFPITNKTITLSTTKSESFTINDNKRINILSVSYWGKDYTSCPPSLFRINLLTNDSKGTSEISYEQNDNQSDKIQILFPSSSSLSTYGIKDNKGVRACTNSNKPDQQIAKIVIMYTESLKPSPSTNFEYFNTPDKITLKNLEINVNQEAKTVATISTSTSDASFKTEVNNTTKIITITPNTPGKFFPYQVSYWYKDYTNCPPNKYKFYELSSLSSNVFTIDNTTGKITISNLKDLYTPFVRSTICEDRPRTIAKIIILYSEDPIQF